jgi:hypothetical protein
MRHQPGAGCVRLIAVAFALLLVSLLHPTPASAVSNFCPSGACDITDPVYVNVYWDDSVDKWDTDVAQSDPGATVARIDTLTTALIHSQYFTDMSQYSIASAGVIPSIVANNCGAPPATIDQAFDQMNAFAGCVFGSHPEFIPGKTILNVFLPPQVVPASPTADFCKKYHAHHDQYAYPVGLVGNQTTYVDVQISIIPTNIACNKTIAAMFELTTHEMAEATTDPVPDSATGWKTCCTSSLEIADQCENTAAKHANFLFGGVSTYYSDATSKCVAFPASPLTVTSSKVCGSGSRMVITLSGALGDLHSGAPWDLTTTPAAYPAPASSRTIYLRGAVSGSHAWPVGNYMGFPADIVGFGKITWKAVGATPNTIVITGFDSHYGVAAPAGGAATISPGDKITLTISSQDTGLSTKTTVTAPAASNVTGLQYLNPQVLVQNGDPSPPIYFGDHPTAIIGKLVDTPACAIENVAVTVSSTDPTPTVAQGTSSFDGSFSIPYQLGGHAGKHTVTVTSPVVAQATVSIHPVADYLSATVGATAGNQPVTLSGAGYAAGVTTVTFRSGANSAQAAVTSVPNSNTVNFLTPASPVNGGGLLQVVASIDGVESVPLAYRYIVPNQPVLSIVTKPSCPADTTSLKVDAYNADGTNKAEQIALTATSAVFLTNSGPQSSTTVASGGSAPLKAPVAVVVITATPSGNASAPAVQKFVLGAPGTHCVPIMAQATPFQIGPIGPVESVSLPALVSRDGRSVIWASLATPALATHYVTSMSAGPVAPTSTTDVEVRDFGSRDLAAAVGAHSSINLSGERGLPHLRFLGPGLLLQSKTRQAANATVSGLIVSFPLPRRANPSSYHILLLAPDAIAWSEQTSSVGDLEGAFVIRAPATDHGIYALAENAEWGWKARACENER